MKVHLAVMDVVRCVVIAAQEHLEFLAQTEGMASGFMFVCSRICVKMRRESLKPFWHKYMCT